MERVRAALGAENNIDAQVMLAVIIKAMENKCSFCGGLGHNAIKCTSKKAFDRCFRQLNYSALWGSLKSKILAETYAAQRLAAAANRAELNAAANAIIQEQELRRAQQNRDQNQNQNQQQAQNQNQQQAQNPGQFFGNNNGFFPQFGNFPQQNGGNPGMPGWANLVNPPNNNQMRQHQQQNANDDNALQALNNIENQ